MKIAHKTLIWTLVGSAVLWTACGKEDKKTKPASAGPVAAKPMDEKTTSPADAKAKGFWLRSVTGQKDKAQQITFWEIELPASDTSRDGKLTINAYCLKGTAEARLSESMAMKISSNTLNPGSPAFTAKDVNPGGNKQSPFSKGECMIKGDNTNEFAIVVSETKLLLRKGTVDFADMCKLTLTGEGNDQKLVSGDDCKDKVSFPYKAAVRRDEQRAGTGAGASSAGSGAGSSNGGAGSTAPGTALKAEDMAGYLMATRTRQGTVQVDDVLQITKDNLSLIRYCTTDKGQVTSTTTFKAKMTDKEIEITEILEEKKASGDIKCELAIKKGKFSFVYTALTTKVSDEHTVNSGGTIETNLAGEKKKFKYFNGEQ